MKGTFTSHPETLLDAINCISQKCAAFDWAISLQSGPFREIYFTEEDDPRNTLDLFHDSFSANDTTWFKRGILPIHAPNLIHDEWSYYLGFNASDVDIKDFHKELQNNISPRKQLFDVIKTTPSVYLIFVDEGWWECFSSMSDIITKVMISWDGKLIDSDRWEDD